MVIAFLWLATLPSAFAGSPRRVTFLPQWFPQAQFAGHFVAMEKGFYRNRGINLVLLRGGPGASPEEAFRKGKADFATLFLAEGIRLRNGGLKLVHVAQIVQRSGVLLVARKSGGILNPADFEGKTVSVWEHSRAQQLAFFRRYNVHPDIVPQTFTPNLFLRGGVDAASAMVYNEYHTMLNAGLNEEELSVFAMADHGLNFPEDGIWCREELCLRSPEVCRSFAAATLEGWSYAFEHPEEALDIVMKYVEEAKINSSRTHQRWMLARMKDLIRPAGLNRPPGRLDRVDYDRVAQALADAGIIRSIPSYGDVHVQDPGEE
ncbi:MAG: ABC transporter substrate-binding protein [Syntrophaceae bacterium]|nr:ABC transporter substrate-binding protein [Syntrophaceae bacterium]